MSWRETLLFSQCKSLVKASSEPHGIRESDLWEVPAPLHPIETRKKSSQLKFDSVSQFYRSLFAACHHYVWRFSVTGVVRAICGLSIPLSLRWFLTQLDQGDPLSLLVPGIMLLTLTMGHAILLQHFYVFVLSALQQASAIINQRIVSELLAQKGFSGCDAGAQLSMISRDSEAASQIFFSFSELIYSILVILSCIGVLIALVGKAALVGLAFSASALAISLILARHMRQRQKNLAALKDKRISSILAFISSILGIKALQIENRIEQSLAADKNKEAVQLQSLGMIELYSTATFMGSTLFSIAATLIASAWLGQTLSPAVAFPIVSVFLLMDRPLRIMTEILSKASLS